MMTLLLLAVLLAPSLALSGSSSCPYETLPQTLNTPAYLALRDEMHIQGTFLTDYDNGYHGETTQPSPVQPSPAQP